MTGILKYIVTGVVVPVLVTLSALGVDRWLLRDKREEEARQKKIRQLQDKIEEMQDYVDELIELAGSTENLYHKRDRFERYWRQLEKMFPIVDDERSKQVLPGKFSTARNALSPSGPDYAKRQLQEFQCELENFSRRLDKGGN